MGAGRKRRRRRGAASGVEALTDEDIQEELVDRVINVMALGESGCGMLRRVNGSL